MCQSRHFARGTTWSRSLEALNPQALVIDALRYNRLPGLPLRIFG